MRTVDPDLWSSRVKGRRLVLARPFRFGSKPGREAWLRGSLQDAAAEFMRTCSVQSVRRLVSPHTGTWERYRWMFLLLVTLAGGVLVASLDVAELVGEPPLHVRLQSSQHSVRHSPFPAVAICSYNVISEEALRRTILFIASKDLKRQFTLAELRSNLLSFGSLVTLTLPPTLDLEFMPFITNVGAGYRFNVTILMVMLAPKCESMLLRCSWRGKITPCNRLFALRPTSVGYCCVFNGRYQPEDYNTPPRILDMVGADHGLSVIMKDEPDDVAFLRQPTMGAEVLIFDGSEFPMLEGGAVRVGMTWPNSSVSFTISTKQQRASSGLSYYTEAWRGCRLRKPGAAPALRSYGWCLLECRRRAALQLCGCVPYTLQPRPGELICSLNQLSCLHKHKEKFLYYYPYGSSTAESLSEESQDALDCEDCRADCARPVYSATAAVVPLQNRTYKMVGLSNEHNISELQFFYQSKDQHLYAVEGNSKWYETFGKCERDGSTIFLFSKDAFLFKLKMLQSRVSIISQWMSLVGAPLAAAAELAFHFTVRWRHHYVRRRELARRYQV